MESVRASSAAPNHFRPPPAPSLANQQGHEQTRLRDFSIWNLEGFYGLGFIAMASAAFLVSWIYAIFRYGLAVGIAFGWLPFLGIAIVVAMVGVNT